MMLTAIGAAAIALTWHAIAHLDAKGPSFASFLTGNAPVYLAGLGSLSVAVHAALRHYFGKQRILDG